MKPTAESIAQCDKFEYFLFNNKDVYRVNHGYILDNRGVPLGMRFECPKHLWESKLSCSDWITTKEK